MVDLRTKCLASFFEHVLMCCFFGVSKTFLFLSPSLFIQKLSKRDIEKSSQHLQNTRNDLEPAGS